MEPGKCFCVATVYVLIQTIDSEWPYTYYIQRLNHEAFS